MVGVCGSTGAATHLHDVFCTQEEDLINLSNEEEELVSRCQSFNLNLGKSSHGGGGGGEGWGPGLGGEQGLGRPHPDPNQIDSEKEVVVFGDVVLDEEETQLLNLGPDYMVVSDLSQEDMQVESAITMTKVRWGRLRKRQEGMTDGQVGKEDEEKTEDDLKGESEDVAIEEEA